MNFFSNHWHGRFSVSKAGWLSSIVALLLVLPTNALELHSFFLRNGLSGFGDLMSKMSDGSIVALTRPSLISEGLDQIVEIVVLIWWSVGAWRSCQNPNHNNNGKERFWFFKLMIIFAAFAEIYELYDFIITLTGIDG